ncbi:hypothetical protein IP88_07955 [alpha proteobacterium AAP81b]|nr:hypothetical protein IP88_07955 [alpha proteobacterium AAP81b]
MNRRQLILALLVGIALQVAMVIAGHGSAAVRDWFALGGMGISALAGWLAARGGTGWAGALAAGGIAGGVCAAVGIGVSVVLGDVPETLLLMGTAASLLTGLIGGAIARAAAR